MKKERSEGKIITGVTLVEVGPNGEQLYQWGDDPINNVLWLCGWNCATNVKVGDVGRLVYKPTPSEGLYWFEKYSMAEIVEKAAQGIDERGGFLSLGLNAFFHGEKTMHAVNRSILLEAMVKTVAREICVRGFTNAYDLELTLTRILSGKLDEFIKGMGNSWKEIADETTKAMSILPMIIENNAGDVVEEIICVSISGGNDYVHGMPRRLSLMRFKHGEEYGWAEYEFKELVEAPTSEGEKPGGKHGTC